MELDNHYRNLAWKEDHFSHSEIALFADSFLSATISHFLDVSTICFEEETLCKLSV